ncbi:recombinase family protein [Natronolimnobius sp. AArcel1]|uniref:recombinase family protein n=1 Tax=Natronolimnobius sp. AArcel1 TaxID=1679093 RepID=UPI0019D12898|nr:recombinase family protein [Natronolimnobius sp. AArcel1]
MPVTAGFSTADQNLDRQLQSTSDYARDEFDGELGEIETYRDKSTGTDTSRSGYREMMDAVENSDVEAVVVVVTEDLRATHTSEREDRHQSAVTERPSRAGDPALLEGVIDASVGVLEK